MELRARTEEALETLPKKLRLAVAWHGSLSDFGYRSTDGDEKSFLRQKFLLLSLWPQSIFHSDAN
jgi:hypothetical protein